MDQNVTIGRIRVLLAAVNRVVFKKTVDELVSYRFYEFIFVITAFYNKRKAEGTGIARENVDVDLVPPEGELGGFVQATKDGGTSPVPDLFVIRYAVENFAFAWNGPGFIFWLHGNPILEYRIQKSAVFDIDERLVHDDRLIKIGGHRQALPSMLR